MKKKIKIVFDADVLEIIIPGASDLEGLPRKRKKKLKKYVAKKIMEIALDEALRIEAFDKIDKLKLS